MSQSMNGHDHVLVVCDHVDAIQHSGFILAGFIASENVDLPCFGGPWTDYQCHSETTSNQLHGPCGFPGFLISTSNATFCSM